MCFKENFIRLCNNSGKSPSSVCHAVGISAAAFAQWTEKTIPRQATLIKIADYFGVPVDALTPENEKKKDPAQMSREEKISYIMQKYSQMPEEDRKALEQFADYLLEKREKTPPGDSSDQ